MICSSFSLNLYIIYFHQNNLFPKQKKIQSILRFKFFFVKIGKIGLIFSLKIEYCDEKFSVILVFMKYFSDFLVNFDECNTKKTATCAIF